MERLFVDTSCWYALTNRRDPDHDATRAVLHAFEGRLVTSNYVFDETITLCRYRLSHEVASTVGQTLLDAGTVDLIRVTTADERDAWIRFLDRGDQRYSFTDCTSFVLLERLGMHRVGALDADFRREGFDLVP